MKCICDGILRPVSEESVIGLPAIAEVPLHLYPLIGEPRGCGILVDAEAHLWYGACIRRESQSATTQCAVFPF